MSVARTVFKTKASSTDDTQNDLNDTRDDSNDNGGSLLIDDQVGHRSESALSIHDIYDSDDGAPAGGPRQPRQLTTDEAVMPSFSNTVGIKGK